MSFNTNWDVEQYRHHWDSDDQWEVRRQFMLAHKDKFPEAKLVCLAQVYANIEFLQCSYPAKVMEQVKALSAELDETVLEKRRQKQNVTFVKGGDDNKCKDKAEKRPPSNPVNNPGKRSRWEIPSDSNRPPNRPTASSYFESKPTDCSLPTTNSSKIEPSNQYSVQQSYYTSTYYNRPQNQPANKFVPDSDRGPGAHRDFAPGIADSVSGHHLDNNTKSSQNLVSRTTTISGKSPVNDGIPCNTDLEDRCKCLVELVSGSSCVDNLGRQFLYEAASKAKLKVQCEWQETSKKQVKFKCLVYIDDILVATSGAAVNKRKAKVEAFEFAIKKLQNSQVKIVKNGTGQLELISLDSFTVHIHDYGNDHDQDYAIDPATFAAPGPLEILAPEDLLTMARTHFKTFILIEDSNLPSAANPISILQNSSNLNGRSIEYKFTSCPTSTMPFFWRCLIKICDVAVGEGTGVSKVEARKAAAVAALELLRSVAFTVVVKQPLIPGRTLSKVDLGSGEDNSKHNLVNEAIPDDNVGNKLLRLMGWSGSGGLGRPGNEGIVEPIQAEHVRGRQGFGLPSCGVATRDFLNQARKEISEYASTTVPWALAFTSEFSKDERAALHKIASRFRLKSNSRGKGKERYLVISQRVDRIKIIEQLVTDGGSNENYTVIPPSGKPLGSIQNAEQVASKLYILDD